MKVPLGWSVKSKQLRRGGGGIHLAVTGGHAKVVKFLLSLEASTKGALPKRSVHPFDAPNVPWWQRDDNPFLKNTNNTNNKVAINTAKTNPFFRSNGSNNASPASNVNPSPFTGADSILMFSDTNNNGGNSSSNGGGWNKLSAFSQAPIATTTTSSSAGNGNRRKSGSSSSLLLNSALLGGAALPPKKKLLDVVVYDASHSTPYVTVSFRII